MNDATKDYGEHEYEGNTFIHTEPGQHPTPEPVRIEDMAPGVRAAVERASLVLDGFVQHNWASSISVHEWYLGELRKLRDAVRDVTPPPAPPRQEP